MILKIFVVSWMVFFIFCGGLVWQHRKYNKDLPLTWKACCVFTAALLSIAVASGFCFEQQQAKIEEHKQETIRLSQQSLNKAKNKYEASLMELVKEVPGEVGFVFYDPLEDITIEYQGDRSFEMASVYKLFVTWATLHDVQNGDVALGAPLPGWGGSVQDGLKDMITWSDNASAEALGQMCNWSRIDELLHKNGLQDSTFHPQVGGYYTGIIESTPRDLVHFLSLLCRGDILDESRTEYFLKLLVLQEFNNTLTPGLSESLHYGHKTGWLDQCFNDAGIIYDEDRPFYIAVMTTGWTSGSPAAEQWYERLGRATSAYIKIAGHVKEKRQSLEWQQAYEHNMKGFSQRVLHHRQHKQ